MKHLIITFLLLAGIGNAQKLANADGSNINTPTTWKEKLSFLQAADVSGSFQPLIADGDLSLSKLDDASATNGQVIKWNGSAWAPAADAGGTVDNAAVNEAIETNPAATRESAELSDPNAISDALNWQPNVMKKMLDWESLPAAPLRVMTVGDSLSTGITLAASMGQSGSPSGGVIGMNPTSSSGLTFNSTDWLTGFDQIAVGGNAVYYCGDANGQRADRLMLAYIREATGGYFDCSVSTDGGSTWTIAGAGTGKTFTADSGTDTITSTAHGFSQGTGVWLSVTGGSLPTASGGNLAASTNYYVIYVDANTYKLARTPVLAAAGTAIDLTGNGSGTMTATPYSGMGISTVNGSKIGAVTTINLSTSNSVSYQLRVNNITGGPLKLVAAGLYNSQGAGVIQLQGIANVGGLDIVNFGKVPAEVFDPIWTALAPDLCIVHFADYAYEWQTKLTLTGGETTNGGYTISFAAYPPRYFGNGGSYLPFPQAGDRITGPGIQDGTYITAHTEGSTTATISKPATATASGLTFSIPGAWTDFYTRAKTAYAATDYVIVSMNPSSDAAFTAYPRWLTGTYYSVGDKVVATASPSAVNPSVNDIFVCSSAHTSGESTKAGIGSTGTAQSGGASTIQLASSAGGTSAQYVGGTIQLISGPGSPVTATISGYDEGTKTVTISSSWAALGVANPTSSTTYDAQGLWQTVWARDQFDATSIAGGKAHCLRQAKAQREWAVANNESFINGFSMFRGFTEAVAAGLMAPEDKIHPTTIGHRFKNQRIWDSIPISRLWWGSLGTINSGASPLLQTFSSAGIGTAPIETTRALHIRQSSSGGLTLWDRSNIKTAGSSSSLYVDNNVLHLTALGNGVVAKFPATPMPGMHPQNAAGQLGGRESFWWNLGGNGIRLEYTPVTGNYSVLVTDYVINVTANDATVTLPSCSALNSSTSSGTNGTAGAEGRIYIIKNSTAANTTTIATAGGQTIDGSAPGTLSAGQSIKVQSTGAGWITIP